MDEKDSPNDPGHVGPEIYPSWLDVLRQTVMFILGVWLILYSSVTEGYDIPFLITGLILFGMIPVERVLYLKRRERRKNEAEKEEPPTPE